ncbi:MAG TPA: LysR substrate-binding domain-containing protein, partial [Parvularculaceae bacterium]|nr:LysR substrate-binding domain-containing protein [Parvularculaceae bacterium]
HDCLRHQMLDDEPLIAPRAMADREIDAARGPKFNQSSLVIEAAVAGKGVALAKSQLALADLEAARLVIPFDMSSPSAFAYYVVHPESRRASPAVKAFKEWLRGEATATPDTAALSVAAG